MQIVSRKAISADGYVAAPDGRPAQLVDPAFASGHSRGIRQLLRGKEAALMIARHSSLLSMPTVGHGRT
jgi:hypothetical protein